MYPETMNSAIGQNGHRRFWPGLLGRLRIDVDDGGQTVPPHRRRSARENCRGTRREGPRRSRLRQQLSAMAATKPQERRRSEKLSSRRFQRSSQLPERPADVAWVRSRDDE
jgi:hypothetical protein